jgi:FKBP-type peptidyl-prolyl cis-trans isomerase
MIGAMRLLLLAVFCLVFTTGFVQDEPVDKVSFGLGFRLGEDVRHGLRLDGIGADPELIIRGFADGLGDRAPMIDEAQLRAILNAVHREMQDRLARRLLEEDEAFRRLAEENLAAGRAFREAFGKRAGVVTTPRGLQFEIVQPGEGAAPSATDAVVLSYRFLRLDGAESARGERELVALDDVFEGGRQVLLMMKPGAVWHVAIPPELAFGAVGSYPDVEPNETLVGRLELHAVQPGGAAP